jgi:predicted RNA-binding protein YlqC (UPF0109 family)
MRELVGIICGGLGLNEGDLAFEETHGEAGRTLTVTMPYSAVQTLDGREHRTAKAVRLVLSASAAAKAERLNLVARAKD